MSKGQRKLFFISQIKEEINLAIRLFVLLLPNSWVGCEAAVLE